MFTPATICTRWPHRRHGSLFCRSDAFTLVEILVVVAILAVLALLAMPSISRMLVSGQIAKSTSNLKQIHHGIGLYVAENNGNYPMLAALSASEHPGITAHDRANAVWYEGVGRLLYPEIRQKVPPGTPWMFNHPSNPAGYKGTVFRSPAAEPNASFTVPSYGMNEMLSAGKFRKYPLRFRGSTTGLIADNNRLTGGGGPVHNLHPTWSGSQRRLNPRYGASAPHAGDGRATVLYLDGHVEVLDAAICEQINSNPNHKFWGDKL
jgi:prepilin-type N-terminal cleavage/methylation domain-containing protein/prepilin-type processing-associated H-X9-DG protein